MSEKFYKYSNKADLNHLPLIFGGCLVVIFILGIIYNYACTWIPFIYTNILITIFYGSCVGIANLAVIRIGNIRNRMLMFTIGAILSIIAIYFSWITFAMTRTEVGYKDGFMMMFHGGELLRLMPQWAQEKTFIFVKKPIGADSVEFYYWVWFFEAFLIMLFAELCTHFMTRRQVFCEACHKWCEGDFELKVSDNMVAKLTSSTKAKEQNKCLKQALLVANFTTLLKADKFNDNPDESYLQYSINYCEKCENLAVISVERHVVEITNEKVFNKDLHRKFEQNYIIISGLLIPQPIAKELIRKQ